MKKWLAPLLALGVVALYCWQNDVSVEPDLGHLESSYVVLSFFVSGILSVVLMGIPIAIALVFGEKGTLRRWFTWGGGRSWWQLGLLFLFLVTACEGIMGAFAPEANQVNVQIIEMLSLGERLLLLIPVCVLIPVAEECLFRGVFLEALPRVYAVPISALLFAVAHGINLYCFGLFFFGLVLGLVALRTRSLLPCFLLHGLFNALSLVFA